MNKLSLQTINAVSPYEVTMVASPNTYRFVTDYGVDIAVSFDLDDLLEQSEAYMFNINNANRQIRKLKWLKDATQAVLL